MKEKIEKQQVRIARTLQDPETESQRAERIAQKARRSEAALAEKASEEIWLQSMQRRAGRIARWALNRDHREIAQLFGQAVVVAIETRKSSRVSGSEVGELISLSAVWREVAKSAETTVYTQKLYRNAGAREKLRRDPKQAAKREARVLWEDWQAGRMMHKSGAAFARFIVDRFPEVTSTKTIERWCTKWMAEREKEASS